ncbi:MAG: class II aldolase/adducin family protein [Arachnia sp.]
MTQFDALITELSAVGEQAVARGLVLATGGNLSARHPGGDEFVVTGSGTYLDSLRPSDFTVMNLAGEILAGDAQPSSEWKLHQRTYRACPEVNAVVHVHPQYSVLLDLLGYPIRLLTQDHAYYVGSVGTTPFYPNGSDELADSAAEQSREHPCVILGHHGSSCVGPDIAMAFRRALNLEEAGAATYRALLLGDTTSQFPREKWDVLRHA